MQPGAARRDPWWLLAFFLPMGAILLAQQQVNDLAYQIAAGDLMLRNGAILRTDPFTYTILGAAWTNAQWGAQVAFAVLFDAIGWRGLLLFQAVVVGGCYAATYVRARRLGAASLVAGALTLGGFLTAALLPGALAPRPQTLVLPLFVAAAWIVRGREEHRGRLWWLPVIGIVWANLHGTFFLLSVLLGAAFVHDLVTRAPTRWLSGIFLGASLLTPFLTPWGPDIYRYVAEVASSPVVRDVIAEWQPLLTRWPAGAVFVGVCVAMLVVVLRHRTAQLRIDDGLGLVALSALAVWSGRNVLWWSVFAPPAVGALLAGWSPGGAWSRRAVAVVGAAMAALLAVGLLRVVTLSVHALLTEDASPGIEAAVREAAADGRVFASRWQSWFEHALPDVPMFTDARVELFPDAIWRDHFGVVSADEGWARVLDRWDVRTVVVSRDEDAALAAALALAPGWGLAFEDADGLVFRRTG